MARCSVRHQAPARLGDREDRVFAGDHHVARSRHSGSAAEAAALDQRQGRHGTGIEPAHRLGGQPARRLVLGRPLPGNAADPGEIGTGLEVPAVALDHHHAQAVLVSQRIHGGMKAGKQPVVVGVVDLWAVERDRRDAAPVDTPQDGVVHRQSAFR